MPGVSSHELRLFDNLVAHLRNQLGIGCSGRKIQYPLRKAYPLSCLHLGHIYEGRRIDTFCAGLSLLVKKQKLDPDTVKVLFVGDTDHSQIAACREVAGELMDSGMIEFRPRVSKEEARQFLWEADLLLVFQGAYRAQIPLKFYEYLSTGKPIFAVSQDGALSKVIAQTGVGIWAEEDDPSEIGEKFLLALTLPRSRLHSSSSVGRNDSISAP